MLDFKLSPHTAIRVSGYAAGWARQMRDGQAGGYAPSPYLADMGSSVYLDGTGAPQPLDSVKQEIIRTAPQSGIDRTQADYLSGHSAATMGGRIRTWPDGVLGLRRRRLVFR